MAETELHALVVKMEADLSGLVSELKRGKEEVSGFGKQTAAVFAGNLLADGAKMIGSAVLDFAKTLSVDAVQAALESEAAVTRLNTALRLSGQFSEGTSKSLQDLAAELQATTKYEDDAIIGAQGLIQSLGKLSEDGLKQATRAAVDLSAGLGIDLQQAAMMVGKAAAGETGTFARYGLKIEEAGTKAEVFARTMAVVNSQLGGSAASQAKTFGGAIAQLGNSFGDMKEEIGKLVTDNPVFAATVAAVTKEIQALTANVTSNKGEWMELAGKTLIGVIEVMVGLGSAADAVGRVLTAAFYGIETAVLGAGTVIAKTAALFSDEWATSAEIMAQLTEESAARVGKAFTEDTMLGETTTLLARVGDAAQAAFSELDNGAKRSVASTQNLKGGLQELSAEQERMAEAGKKLSEKLIGVTTEEQVAAQLELLKAQREAELVTKAEYDAKELELLNQKLIAETALIEAAHEQGKIGESQYVASIQAINEKHRADKMKRDLEMQKWDQQKNKEREANMRSTLGSISTLMQSNSKELFAIGKAAAMAQATIDGIAAVQKALASAPPPFNFALAALVGAAQAVNLAKIASAQPPQFAMGGTVPGFGNRDTVPIIATPGEEIIDRSTSKRLREALSGEGGGFGAQEIRVVLELKDGLMDFIEAKTIERQELGISIVAVPA